MIKAFEKEMRDKFGARLLDLSLRGSFSRGEARQGSDTDYYILLDKIESEDLVTMERLSKEHAVSPFLLSSDEFDRLSRFGRFQFFCENKRLFERLGAPPPTAEDGWELMKNNFENALHACRHYLLEPHEPSLAIRRMFYFIKSIDFSLRAYMLLKAGMYPGTRKALRNFVSDMPEACWIIDTIETWKERKADYEKDARGFLLRLDANLRKLLMKVLP